MPDLRLLDADGRELRRLVGFTSPERLAKACRDALDQLAGKGVTQVGAAVRRSDVAVTEASIAAAVARARAYLEREAGRGLPKDVGVAGLGDAVLLGLSCAGAAAD